MAWDFQTDPDSKQKLDWVAQFCDEKVEPLDYVFPYAVRSPDPVVRRTSVSSSRRSATRGSGRCSWTRTSGAPASAG